LFTLPSMVVNQVVTNQTAITIWNGLDNVFQAIVDVNTGPNSTGESFSIHRQIFATVQNGSPTTLNEAGVNFTPAANDVIYDQEWYCDSTGNPNLTGGYACSRVTDETQNVVWDCSQASGTSCPSFQLGSTANGASALGQQAEFVIENDTFQVFPSNAGV
jgi:hypothetical protein